MDGAAARGRLDIVKRLHSTRTEGCSSAAFVGAAAGGYLNILLWLQRNSRRFSSPRKEIKAAAKNGHVQVVKYLRLDLGLADVQSALKVAAANGQVAAMEILLPGVHNYGEIFIVAAANDQAAAVQFMIERYDIISLFVCDALDASARGGHVDILEILVEEFSYLTLGSTLTTVVESGRPDVLRWILVRCTVDPLIVGPCLVGAARKDRCDLVEILLQKFPRGTEGSFISTMPGLALCEAVQSGRLNMVKLLLKWNMYAGATEFERAVLLAKP